MIDDTPTPDDSRDSRPESEKTATGGPGGSRTPQLGSTWEPATVSRVTAGVITVSFLALLIWQLPKVLLPIVVAALGACSLALGFVLVDDNEFNTLASCLLTVPIGLGLLGGGAVMTMGLVSDIFPVEEPALLSFGTLVVASYVGIVVGATLAILGLLLGARPVVTRANLRAYSNLTFITGIVPAGIGLGLAVSGFFVGEGSVMHLFRSSASGIWSTLVTADGSHLHLGSFLVLVVLAAGGIKLALSALPVRELLADRREDGWDPQTIDSLERGLTPIIAGSGLLATGTIMAEFTLSATQLEQLLGTSLFGTIQQLTTVGSIRVLLATIGFVTVGAALVGIGFTRYARISSRQRNRRVMALLAGSIVTIITVGLAPELYTSMEAAIYERLPDLIAGDFLRQSNEVATTYGESTIILLFVALVIGLTGGTLLSLRAAISFGYLSIDSLGYALASAGLFLAAMFAGTLGLSPLFVIGGIAGSLVVWDAGRFGSILGKEIGAPNARQSLEFVHLLGTLGIAAVGIGLALGVDRYVGDGLTVDTGPALLALVFIVIGILALVEALR